MLLKFNLPSNRRTCVALFAGVLTLGGYALGDEAVFPTTAPTTNPSDAQMAADAQPAKLTDEQLMAKGLSEISQKNYQEALTDFQQINLEGKDDGYKASLQKLMNDAQHGSDERKAARAAFEKGQAALNAGNATEAATDYKEAIDNKYADPGTAEKAKEQLAVAQAQAPAGGAAAPAPTPAPTAAANPDLRNQYNDAKAAFRRGDLADAKTKFQTLQTAGYKAPLFERSVTDYLSDIDKAMAAKAAEATPAEAATPAVPTTEPVVAVPTPTPEATATPPVPEVAPPTPAEAPGITAAQASDAYKAARDQYRKGDWIEARKNFVIARDGNYKTGLFEDSPAKYLGRMDAKEQADAAKAAKEQAAREAVAQATAAPNNNEVAVPPPPASGGGTEVAVPPPPAGTGQPTATPEPKTGPTEVAVPPPPANGGAGTEVAVPPPPPATPAPTRTPPPTVAVGPSTPSTETTPAPTPGNDLQSTADLQRVTSEKNAFDAKQLVAQADAALAAGNTDEALQKYAAAVDKDPSNQAAITGKNQMMVLTGRSTGGTSQLDRVAVEIEQSRQAISYNFDQALTDTNSAITANNFAEAQAKLNVARVARNQNPQIFNTTELNGFDSRIASAQLSLDNAKSSYDAAQANQAQTNARDSQVQREQAEAQQRRDAVANLIKQSRRLTEDGKFEEALGVIDQILLIDPNNEYAKDVRPLVEDRAMLLEQRRYREDFDRQLTRQLNQAEEKRVPYNDILRYPENWPGLTETHDRVKAEESGEQTNDDAITLRQLAQKLPEVKFDAVPFTDAIDFFHNVTTPQANIFVNWKALEGAGIDKSAPVTLHFHDIPFSKALELVLNDVGGTVKLGYTVSDGIIQVSTLEDLPSKLDLPAVYDINDLLLPAQDFTGPQINLSSQQTSSIPTPGQTGGGGSGGGQSLFGGSGGGGQNGQNGNNPAPTRMELLDGIMTAIKTTINHDSWVDNGAPTGTGGTLAELPPGSGQLVVVQTSDANQKIRGLLAKLREARAIQVTIETRFLKVQRDFLNEIGVDFDFSIPNTNSHLNGGQPIQVNQSSAAFTNFTNLDTGIPGNLSGLLAGPSLTTTLTYLDDFQASLLIRATEAQQTSSTITAPRITLYNGEEAFVAVNTQQAYVSSLTPVVGSNAAAFSTQPNYVNSGVVLDVKAAVSADRHYVKLVLQPTLQDLLAIVPFVVAGTNITPTGNNAATQPISTNGIIQLPEVRTTQVATTVDVPDGGTLLLGGETISGQVEREQGVPILSKIPFLKRLFTNRSMSKDDQVLLILVKPTIIIEREQEQKQFPLLTTHTNG